MGSFKIEENLSQQAKQKNKKKQKTSRNKTLSITAAEVTIH